MKKGLLSILAASAVLVGCQNYDDQFDALNTQITSLKTQVEGLAGVQSDVAALKGLISSLQGAVDGVNADLSSQLEQALADIDAVEAAVADVASGEDLAAVQADLDAVGTDVDELLESDAFFNGSLSITSDATLAFAQQLGQKVKVINGDVTITGWEDMDSEAVNAITAQMITITGDVKVRMPSQTYAAITFPELSSADVVTVAQAGSYSFPKLQSATTINLGKNYSSKVTLIDFRALTTITNFYTATVAASYALSSQETNTLNFDEAENMHLTALGYYTPKTLTIVVEEGGTLDMPNFTSQDADGVVRNVTLNVTGASLVELPNYKNGDFTATDVEEVNLSEFYGNVTISGVEEITLGKSATNITINDTATLREATLTGITAPEDTTDKTGPVVNMNGQTNLETLILDGKFTSVDVTGASNLFKLDMSATANSLTMVNNGDLDDVDLEGSAIIDVTLTDADDLTEVTLAHTLAAKTQKADGTEAAVTAGSLIITNNNKLASVVAPEINNIKTLTIQNNVKLEVVDMAKLVNKGATADKANVLIGGTGASEQNKLNATKITDKVNPSTTDIGTIESDTKLETLKGYLKKAAGAPGTTGVKVYFDSADLHVEEQSGSTDIEQNNLEITTTADVPELTVMEVTASTSTGNTVRQTRTYVGTIGLNALKDVNQAAAADVFTVDYPNLANDTFKVTDTDVNGDSVDNTAELVTYFSNEADGDDLSLTMTVNDSYKTNYYKISYTSSGVAETVSAAGNLRFKYGAVSFTASGLTAGSGSSDIASAIAIAINAVASYVATADGSYVKVQPQLAGTSNADISPIPQIGLPTGITLYKTATLTTANFSASATNSASDYELSAANAKVRYGYRITIVNDSQVIAATATITRAGTHFGAPELLVAGTNVATHTGFDSDEINSRQYVATFAQISNATVTAGSTTDKSGWL